MTFYHQCIYAAYGIPIQKVGVFTIKKARKKLAQALDEANKLGQPFAIFFADASSDSSMLIAWSVLKKIRVQGNQTFVEFALAKKLKRKISVSALKKVSDDKGINDHIRRGVILCHTPHNTKKLIEQENILGCQAEQTNFYDPKVDEELSAFEGEPRQQMITHRNRERSLREAKIQAVMKQTGRIVCEVVGCEFDFYETYGDIGKGYAQVHHLVPLSKTESKRLTTLDELAIVCANCHAMIHRGGRCRNLAGLRR